MRVQSEGSADEEEEANPPKKRIRDKQSAADEAGAAADENTQEAMSAEKELVLLFMAKAQEHQFDCPVPGCSGKLKINSDLCRFGHGVIATCHAPGAASAAGLASTHAESQLHESHKCKWCHLIYAFTPAKLWGEHLSCCSGSSAPTQCACVDAADLQPQISAHRAERVSSASSDIDANSGALHDNADEKVERTEKQGDKVTHPSRKVAKRKGTPTQGVHDVSVLTGYQIGCIGVYC